MSDKPRSVDQPRRQSMLGIILLALHPLFGITAVIGMLISSMSLKSVEGTLYHSHLKWQIATFWIGLAAYITAFFAWQSLGLTWPIVIAFAFVAFRVATNLNRWLNHKPLGKLI